MARLKKRIIKKWSLYFFHCQDCKRTDKSHMAKGLCKSCYLKRYRENPDNIERIKEAKHRWYLEVQNCPEFRDRQYFDGMREVTLTRDNYTCTECGNKNLSQLVVHHKDGNGRGCKNPDNSLENLVTLCRGCHMKVHEVKPKNEWFGKRWAKHYDSCLSCGRTDHKHQSFGLCWYCRRKIEKNGQLEEHKSNLKI